MTSHEMDPNGHILEVQGTSDFPCEVFESGTAIVETLELDSDLVF